ncbi:MAG: transcription elongation factor GreB [Paracoccaceae bacterium]|jgi:transcription elongation factor GreB
MPDLKVIDQVGNKKQIFFGATVTLEKENGVEVRYRIVGPDETDAKRNFISIDSPLVKAILKKEVDDEVMISIGDSENLYTVLSIEY